VHPLQGVLLSWQSSGACTASFANGSALGSPWVLPCRRGHLGASMSAIFAALAPAWVTFVALKTARLFWSQHKVFPNLSWRSRGCLLAPPPHSVGAQTFYCTKFCQTCAFLSACTHTHMPALPLFAGVPKPPLPPRLTVLCGTALGMARCPTAPSPRLCLLTGQRRARRQRFPRTFMQTRCRWACTQRCVALADLAACLCPGTGPHLWLLRIRLPDSGRHAWKRR